MKRYHELYVGYNKSDFKELWNNCTFVFDTNVLLDLYRKPKESRQAMLDVLKKYDSKIWLPHQVVHEFYINRVAVIQSFDEPYAQFQSNITSLKNNIIDKLNMPTDDIKLISLFEDIKVELENIKRSNKAGIELDNDEVLKLLLDYFDNKVGSEFTTDELKDIYSEGKKRYDNKIPPGYKDSTKDPNKQFGDYVLWKQILNHFSINKSNVIFVTNDSKEDWIVKFKDTPVGPRHELRSEFHRVVGKRFHILNSHDFLSQYSSFENIDVSDEVLQDYIQLTDSNFANIEDLINHNLFKHSETLDRNSTFSLGRRFIDFLEDISFIISEGTEIEKVNLKNLFESCPDKNLLSTLSDQHKRMIASFSKTLISQIDKLYYYELNNFIEKDTSDLNIEFVNAVQIRSFLSSLLMYIY